MTMTDGELAEQIRGARARKAAALARALRHDDIDAATAAGWSQAERDELAARIGERKPSPTTWAEVIDRLDVLSQSEPVTLPGLATSCFHNAAGIAASGMAPVAITLGRPRFKLAYTLAGHSRLLAPTPALFKMTDEAAFRTAYRARLDEVGAERVASKLCSIAEAACVDALVLLCFERLEVEGEWCHRSMLAAWLEERFGIDVPEIDAAPSAAARLF